MRVRFLLWMFLVLIITSCARRGRPEGGPKDFDKPVMVKADPDFKSLHFDADEIRIYFDEFVKLKDVNSQLIVSPPLKYPLVISPLGTPSKRISLKISDTLEANTTYTFNFGQSVIDNTEGNILENFRYIISTGDYIDSLRIGGTIKDAFDLNMKEGPTIMLYPIDSAYSDSVVFKTKPTYVGSTLDSLRWSVENIKEGTYKLVALNDVQKNYVYNPKEDKIAFGDGYFTVPGDTISDLRLFKEILTFEVQGKPGDISKGHVIIGFHGDSKGIKVRELSATSEGFKSFYYKDEEKDSLHYWFRGYEPDTLYLEVSKSNLIDTIRVRLNEDEIDSLRIGVLQRGTLHLRDTLLFTSNVPIEELDRSKIRFFDQDSMPQEYSTQWLPSRKGFYINFEKKLQTSYSFEVDPGAVTDLFGIQNDSLSVSFKTGRVSDYCSIFIRLQGVKRFPIILHLIDDKGDIVGAAYAKTNQEFAFKNLQPGRFKVRIIYDDNENGQWDTGDFLKQIQPEEVYYIRNIIEAKANWEKIENFNLSQ